MKDRRKLISVFPSKRATVYAGLFLAALLVLSVCGYYEARLSALESQFLRQEQQVDRSIKSEPEPMFYTGNPFTTELWSGQLQAENITGMHYYTWLNSALHNRTDLIANPTDTASYIVETDGTNTWMTNTSTGQREWTSTNASAIYESVIGNLSSGGTMFTRNGAYSMTSPVYFTGTGTSYQRQYNFICESQTGVHFQPSANLSPDNALFVIEQNADVYFANFKVTLPDDVNCPHVFYGKASTTERSTERTIVGNVKVGGGSGGSHWVAYFVNSYGVGFIDNHFEAYGSGGICLEDTRSSVKMEDCELLSGWNKIYVKKANGIAIYLKGTQALGHVHTNGNTYLEGTAAQAGQVGIKVANASYFALRGFTIEYFTDTCIDIDADSAAGLIEDVVLANIQDNTKGIVCAGNYITVRKVRCGAGTNTFTLVELPSGARSNIFEDFMCSASDDSTCTLVNDGGSDGSQPNKFLDWCFTSLNYLPIITKTTQTIIRGYTGYKDSAVKRSERAFTATIPNGQTSVTATHWIWDTPLIVLATGRNSDTVDVYCSARNSTHITLTVPEAVGGNRIVDVYCQWTP